MASILASLHNDMILRDDLATLQDTNDRFLANLQRGGLYSVVPYYLSKPERPGLLFGYGNLDEEEIEEGVRRFARAI